MFGRKRLFKISLNEMMKTCFARYLWDVLCVCVYVYIYVASLYNSWWQTHRPVFHFHIPLLQNWCAPRATVFFFLTRMCAVNLKRFVLPAVWKILFAEKKHTIYCALIQIHIFVGYACTFFLWWKCFFSCSILYTYILTNICAHSLIYI